MDNRLYFIPILFDALDDPGDIDGLWRALSKIVELGRNPSYAEGYFQFLLLMNVVADAYFAEDPDREIHDGTGQLPDNVSDGATGDRAREDIQDRVNLVERSRVLDLLLRRDDEEPRSLQIYRESPKGTFQNIAPGHYELSLGWGRILWEARLTREDVLLAYTSLEAPLPVAADTDRAEEKPAREWLLLDGELTLRVYSGRSSGRMEIIWNRQ